MRWFEPVQPLNRHAGLVWLPISLTLLVATPASAARFGFTVRTSDGRAIKAAEVCTYSAGVTPPEQWFSDRDIECFPAETVVAFPPGRWNVFVVAEGEYASQHPSLLPIDDDPIYTDRGYKELVIEVAPAATVRFAPALPSGAHAVLYFPGTKTTLAFALPMRPGASAITIPAGLRFIPALLSKEGRIRFGELYPGAKAGARVTVSDFARAATRDAIAYLRRVPVPAEYSAGGTGRLPPPRIELRTSDRSYAAEIPDSPVRGGDLVIVKNVDAATTSGVLRLSGPTWEAAEAPVRVAYETTPGTVPPLSLHPAAELRVTASPPVIEWLRGLEETECSGEQTTEGVETHRNALEVWCTNGTCAKPYTVDIDRLWSETGVTFTSLRAGPYELRLRTAAVRDAWRETVSASTGINDVLIDIPLTLLVGKVTRAGTPVRARLSLAGGTALTGADGAYAIRFSKNPDRVFVRECAADAQFVYLPEEPLTTRTQLDIELPAPAVVRVMDRASSQPVSNATVTVMVRDRDEKTSLRVNEVAGRTDPDGLLTLARTPLTTFDVCAKADDYAPACARSDTGKPVTVALVRAETVPGSIEGVSGVNGGMIYFVTSDGVTMEAVAVDSDGRFKHRQNHGVGRHAVFVSMSHPLTVLPVPPVGPLHLRFPSQPPRAIIVRTPTDADYEVGMAIGGVIVPWAAFSRHLSFRGVLPYAVKGEIVIPMVVESAPLTIYLGFRVHQRPPHVAAGVDPFSLPELRRIFPSAGVGREAVIFR